MLSRTRGFFLLLFAFLAFLSHTALAATVPAGACLYALDATADRAFQIAGATSVYTACGIVSESSATDAFEMEGSETLYLQDHAQVSVVGAAQLNGQTKLWDTINNAQTQAVKVTSPGDPFASLTAPTSGTIVSTSHVSYDMNNKPHNNTLSPGVYCGGMTIGNTNGATFTFSPGLYVMAGGGLTLNSQAVVGGTGVTFYITSSTGWGCSGSSSYTPLTISGQVTANLTAPTSGTYDGILFFGNRTGCSTAGSCHDQINGGSTTVLNGALYFKSDEIEITGSNASGYTMLVADKIYINGNSTFATDGSPFDGITVAVSPSSAALNPSQTQQFTATVTNSSNPAVTWSLSPAVGTISSSGLYTAPSTITTQQTITVTATSQDDSAKYGSATITLYPPVSVAVAPASATLYQGQTQQLTAVVVNNPNTAVTWSISPAVGSVSALGLYTAPASVTTSQTVTVTATSVAEPTKFASAAITLSPPIAVSVSPTTATLYASQTQQLTAAVTNTTNTAVTWSVSPAGVGSISPSGIYTAPSSITSQQTVTITATSEANSSISSSAIFTLYPPFTVAVSPNTTTLYPGGTQQFSATVSDATNTAVTWTISGPGSVDSTGLYTAPATIASQQTVMVTATSQANSSVSATATVTLSPSVAVSVTPATATLSASQTQAFAATVTNTSNTAVTWTISSTGAGTIDSTGLYMAPSSIASQETVTVIATSVADTTKSASATITLMGASATLSETFGQALTNIDLTKEGTADWMVFGPSNNYDYGLPFTRKASVTPLISAPSVVGPYSAQNWLDTIGPFSFEDGYPDVQESDILPADMVTGSPSPEFDLVIPADTTQRTLKIYGSGVGGVQMTASLSDGSASAISDTSFSNTNTADFNENPYFYAITYSAASTGQTLTVKFIASDGGYIYLDAATLTGPPMLATPVVASINPVAGSVGSMIAISGSNFGVSQGSSTVTLGGVPAQVSSWSSSGQAIQVVVPTGAQSGPVQVVTSGGPSNNNVLFTLAPTVTNLSPSLGPVGTTVTISGSGFGATQGTGSVAFNGVSATPSSWTDTQITIAVPAGANTGDVVVTQGVAATSTPLFTVLNGALGTPYPVLQIGVHDSPLAINLSAPVNQDWAFWGANGATGSATRRAQTNLISDVTILDGASPSVIGIPSYDNFQYSYTWAGGTPTASGNIPMIGISVSGTNSGFQLTAPADTTVRTLKIYSYGNGLQNAQVNASISDGSSPAASFTLPYVADYGDTLRVYSIDYRAASSGQTLTVQLVSPSGVSIEAATLSPHLPQVDILSPQEGEEFFPNQVPMTFGVDAMQFDSALTSVGVSANGVQQFSMQSPFLSPWSPAPGHYSVQAQATDAAGLANTSDPAHIDVIGSGGSLSVATMAPPSEGESADLTAEGTADWVIFDTPSILARKAGVGQLISNAKVLGDETPYEFQDYNIQFAYEDGTPNLQGTSVEGGQSIYNGVVVNNGYEITVKADTVPRTLRLYVAAQYGGGGKLKAYLSDGSAPVYVDTSLVADDSSSLYNVYAIKFNAASAGQTLTVRWTLGSVDADDGGYIDLYAATLDGQPALAMGPAITQISPTSGGLGTNVTITGTGFGASQGSSTVTFNGIVATPISWSDTQIQVPAPGGSNTGNIVVTVGGTASDPELFSMPPTITSLSAAFAPVGSILTINGYNFGAAQGSSIASVDGINAPVQSWSDSQIQIVVPQVPAYYCSDPVNCSTYIYVQSNTAYSNYFNFTETSPVQLTPATATLYARQMQAFTLLVGGTPTSLPGYTTWSIAPAGAGTIDANGLYTAPAAITSPQTVTVSSTVLIDPPAATATATITLEPPVTVSVSPTTATLNGGQTQQFAATVANATNTAVTWAISPSSLGSITAGGLYTAPAIIGGFQSVTITATSQVDPTKAASATITLSAPCTSPYAYRRILTIDHTKVPNTDQTDFPILFSGVYPFLATTANGGKVQNANGYDILLTSDPLGQVPLDFEIDNYNPTTGQTAIWVRIPTLSHTLDTPVYLWYGSPNITTSQENKAGVWKNGYLSVYHFGSGGTVGLQDSGSSGYTLTGSAIPATGMIGGAASFNGDPTQYLSYENASAYPGGTSAVTLEAWTQFPANGGGAVFGYGDNGYNGARITLDMGPTGPGLDFRNIGPSTTTTIDTNWHHVVGVFDGGGVSTGSTQLYVDGALLPETENGGGVYIDTTELKIGGIPTVTFCCAYTGSVDEVRISSGVRSADWIATEFNSESSPATFYRVSAENAIGVQPDAVSLNASQTLQFSAIPISACSPNVTWSMSPVGVGSLSSEGLYTSPASIPSRQTVTITATGQADPSQTGSATVTLLPTATTSALALSPTTQPPYVVGSSPTFAATLTDQNGLPEAGVEVYFSITGADTTTYTAVTNGNGIAVYPFTGNSAGVDTIQASATVSGQRLSGSVSITWTSPVAANAPGAITLIPAGISPTLNLEALCGAFTDSTGAVIEPLAIGDGPKVFVVPAGATQLQLGVDDGAYFDNHGPGFVVNVNGSLVTVPAGAMPWVWVTGGLNSNFAFGLQDGTAPLVASTNLTPGESVVIAYQSGLNSPGGSYDEIYDANGVPGQLTGVGTGSSTAAYPPTHYMTGLSYTLGSSISFSALVTDVTGTAVAGVPVTFTVTGANAQQFTATTDQTGTAAFPYTGANAGTDTVQAQASLSGATITTSQTTVVWRSAVPVSPTGTLTLTPTTVSPMTVGSQQAFTVYAVDSLGNPQTGVEIALVITKLPYEYLYATTDATGHASFLYTGSAPGTATVRAVALVAGGIVYSNIVDTTWTPATGSTSESITINISAQSTLTLPNALALNGTVTDTNPSATLTEAWTQVSGPGVATFANPQQASTTATFSQPGEYVLQLSASDSVVGGFQQFQVSVQTAAGNQGWLGSPGYGSSISGIVPITTAPGVVLQSGILTYFSASDPYGTNAVVLNGDATGSGQIGTFDTTQLQNGSYWVQLVATDTNGNTSYSDSLVTVIGQYKPGRVTTTVTDLVVPATGLAINIQRQYDSLNAGTVSDFGYGWSLNTNVDLTVDASHNVTFTLGGQRKTFYFTPQYQFFFLHYVAAYTPEPGLAGTLTAQQDPTACPLGYVVGSGSFWECGSGAPYSPLGYTYTDASGTQYTISASGALQSIVDIGGNTLTVTANGITSSTGLSVPFVRDAQGRITQITDPQGNKYLYSYDASGNLATVTYPGITQASTYTYDPNHLYVSGTDFRGNTLPSSAYYGPTDTDVNGLPLNGRLKSVTDALSETTSYAYNLTTNTTTITYPPDGSGNVGSATTVYDSYGMLLASTDPLGLATTNTYDTNHNLISTTDPLNHTTSYTYDANGNKTSSTYPQVTPGANTTSTVAYNQFSEPTSSTDELGNVRTYNYDSNSWPSSVTDSLGTLMSSTFNPNGTMQAGAIGYDITANPTRASQFTYDAYGNRTSSTDALGRATAYTYNTLGQKTSVTEPVPSGSTAAAATTTYTYDLLGNLTQTAAPLGRTTNSTYDANGNKLTDTDANSHTTGYVYDALNRLTTTTYPDTSTATNTYDFRGNVLTSTDQAGNVTKNVYDVAGRLISATKAFGTASATTTSYTYDGDGRKATETDGAGNTTTWTYDAAGNLTAVAGVQGNFTYGYDNARNRVSVTDGRNNTTSYAYDARKRLTRTTYPDTTHVDNTYDGPGNVAGVTDQAGNVVSYTYDAANQLQSVVQTPVSTPHTTSYGYDLLGNLGSVTDANSHTTNDSYDLLSELKTTVLPDGTSTESRAYDYAGNLTSLTHFSGVQTTYNYDSLNRLISRATPGETTVSFTYTATGKRHTMTDASGTTTYSYDADDRLTSKATPAGTLSYTYDAAGNVASIVSSNTNGASMSYTWDSLNRLSSVVDNRLPAGHNTTTYTFDAASNVVTVTYPNGVQSTLAYDSVNRLTGLATVSASSSPVASYGYTLGNTGIRTQAAEAFATGTSADTRNVNWSYDNTYRLTQEQIANDSIGNNGAVNYSLDPVGNRTQEISSITGLPSVSLTFNADDLTSGETYDANGNTTGTGGRTFAYDSENHLVSMNGGAVTIVYDGFGNRVDKTVGGVTTQYLVDDLNPTGYPQVIEEVVGGSVARTYTYGLQRISEEQVISSAWTPTFYGYDGGGTVRQLTNASGAVTDSYEYDAFGNLLNPTSNGTPNEMLYRGEAYDSDLGLYYLRARYYNPLTGRFMSRDPNDPRPRDVTNGKPIDPRKLHKYIYTGGDPVNWIDPLGRDDEIEYRFLVCGGSGDCPALFPGITTRKVVVTALVLGALADLLKNAIFGEPFPYDNGKEPPGYEPHPEPTPSGYSPGW